MTRGYTTVSLCAELLCELIRFPVHGTEHESLIIQAGEIRLKENLHVMFC